MQNETTCSNLHDCSYEQRNNFAFSRCVYVSGLLSQYLVGIEKTLKASK